MVQRWGVLTFLAFFLWDYLKLAASLDPALHSEDHSSSHRDLTHDPLLRFLILPCNIIGSILVLPFRAQCDPVFVNGTLVNITSLRRSNLMLFLIET